MFHSYLNQWRHLTSAREIFLYLTVITLFDLKLGHFIFVMMLMFETYILEHIKQMKEQ